MEDSGPHKYLGSSLSFKHLKCAMYFDRDFLVPFRYSSVYALSLMFPEIIGIFLKVLCFLFNYHRFCMICCV